MCECVDKLLVLMEPYIKDIDDKRMNLSEHYSFLSLLDELVENISVDAMNIFDYNNKDLIIDLIKKNGSSLEEYDANKYILQSEVSEVSHLPQYNDAKMYLDKFCEYINAIFQEKQKLCDELSDEYENLALINNYYNLFKSNNVFVEEPEGLIKMLENFDLDCDEKNSLIIWILKENNKKYYISNEENSNEDDCLDKFKQIIDANKKLLSAHYNELLDAVSEYVDLSKNIHDIIDYDLINKININNILLAKEIWLMKKIEFNYNNAQYNKGLKLITEFSEVEELLDAVRNIKDKKEAIRIIKGENEDEG